MRWAVPGLYGVSYLAYIGYMIWPEFTSEDIFTAQLVFMIKINRPLYRDLFLSKISSASKIYLNIMKNKRIIIPDIFHIK